MVEEMTSGMADTTSMGYGAIAEAISDTEDGIGGLGLPCRKTFRAWARSHFGALLACQESLCPAENFLMWNVSFGLFYGRLCPAVTS